ncbi:plasmid recombination protein [Thioclava sp. L04-15]|uniref:plasmid recombination protein n=1 Tax=Thioclava sp. L04-15 TaxID=1915318 RepID=UPI0011BAB76A|nr:plasmid recombination protein [Thioclava sp. L04-15]TNE93470.1 MAG: hypothetical protein EP337_03425 [Paracoccaceae bacterium]
MKDLVNPPAELARSNPRAASTHIQTCTLSKAKSQRMHDYRLGRIPAYVDQTKLRDNRVLMRLRPLTQVRAENARLREQAGRQRKMKSNAAVVLRGVISFGVLAARDFKKLSPKRQNRAFRKLARSLAKKFATKVESLVVHLDETTIHAHFMLRAYDHSGHALSDKIKRDATASIQDLTHRVLACFCPGIQRGHRKLDRLAAGANYVETLHRSVRALHQDLPREIEEREAELAALEVAKTELLASIDEGRKDLDRLSEEQRTERLALASQKTEMEARVREIDAQDADVRAREEKQQKREVELDRREASVIKDKADLAKERGAQRLVADQLAKRSEEVEAARTEAEKIQITYQDALAAMEGALAEIAGGPLRRDPATGKLVMKDASLLRALPEELRVGLLRPMRGLVDIRSRVDQRSRELDRRGRAFEEKQAAVGEVITALTEGHAEISGGAVVMEDLPHCLKALGESDEDRMIQGILDLLVLSGEVGGGGLRGPRDDEIDGPGMG